MKEEINDPTVHRKRKPAPLRMIGDLLCPLKNLLGLNGRGAGGDLDALEAPHGSEIEELADALELAYLHSDLHVVSVVSCWRRTRQTPGFAAV